MRAVALDMVVLGIGLGHQIDRIFHAGAAALLDAETHAFRIFTVAMISLTRTAAASVIVMTAKRPMSFSTFTRVQGLRNDLRLKW